MTQQNMKPAVLLLMLAGVLSLAACAKKTAKVTPPPPPAPAAPRAGGATEASARVTVNAPIAKATSTPTDEDLFRSNVKDVFFDYDKSAIRADEASSVQNDEAFFSQHPSIKVLVEGHCDERGSEEYNVALGTSRAESLRRALVQSGVPPDRVRTVSYGKEKPFCTQENEQCWQQNRVDHFAFDR